ncbi:MAG: hypothetical protein HC880_08900 [Bacteroidia bacterium]|nr:hypothetical protein [Bacteroidia bacterium]
MYRDYPLTDLDVFFNAPPTEGAASALRDALTPHLKDKTEKQAADFLLRFVQNAFAYQTDQDQFGREKTFFMEEVLYYPYADCEDRSVFYAYLVRELLGLEVVGLDYPGHVATAVHFTEPLNGDYLEWNGKKYLICDPTYLNAEVGQAMDIFRGQAAKVVALKNF